MRQSKSQHRNLYHECSGAQVAAPRLDSRKTCDVAIIGGGYTGLSTAMHLARRGLRPMVVEAGAIAHGCSGRNGGQVNPGLKLMPDEIETAFGPDLGSRMVRMANGAPNEVFGLIDTYGIDCAPARTGTIRAAIDAPGLASVHQFLNQSARRGDPVTFADAREMAARTGTGIYLGGAFDPRGGHLNPLAYAYGLARIAKTYGAQLFSESRATVLSREGSDWNVGIQGGGRISAKALVICTNGYTDDLWPGMRQTIIPVHTYLAASAPLPPDLRRSIMPCGAALFEAAWDVVYYRLDDAGRLIMGGRGPQREPRRPSDFRHLVDYACKLWPQLKGIEWPWYWQGQVAITRDHLPQLVEPEPNVHLMYGYNGRGIAMATLAGRMIAERILSGGKTEVDLPVRQSLATVPFQPFWKVGATTSIGWNLLRDRLRGR